MIALDEQFIRRVYRTSAWVALILSLAVAHRWGFPAAAGLSCGTALSLVCLWTIERGVRRYLRPGASDFKPLLIYLFSMYPALIAALWVLAYSPLISLAALACGVALPNSVIVLKVIGLNMLSRPANDPAAHTKNQNSM